MARKSMNIVDVVAWVETTGKAIRGRRVSNIYYTREENMLLIKLQGTDKILVAEGGRRLHLSQRVRPPQEYKPYPLVVLARKHLRGSRVEDVRLVGEDRVVEIKFSKGPSIIVELVPRGVIALVSSEGLILAADKTLKVKDRVIRPKAPYTPPPPRASLQARVCLEKRQPERDEIAQCIAKGKDVVRGLVRGCGVPGEVAEEALYRAGIPPSTPPSEIEDPDLLGEILLELCKESLQGKGYVVLRGGAPLEASPFHPRRFSEEDYTIRITPSLDDALDLLFAGSTTPTTSRGTTKEEGELARLMESIRRAEERAEEYRRAAETLRKAAVSVSMKYQVIEEILRRASRGEVVKVNGFEVIPHGKTLIVRIAGISLEIPKGSTSERLVVELYKKAGELDSKAERALQVRGEIRERLEELRLKAAAREIAEKVKRRRKCWFERFHWTITRGGLLAVGGRDASQNEAVVKKYLSRGDIFLHANIHGAPAVVLKGGERAGEEDIFDAAVLTAAYSKAWKAGLGSVEVYWVKADQVSFSPPSGEYLAKGGIMVYGRKNFLPRPVPVRLALGIALDSEGIPLPVQGSREAVEKWSLAYVILAPGDMKKEEAAEEVRKALAKVLGKEGAPLVYAVPNHEIMPRIPGRSRVVGVYKGRGEGVDCEALVASQPLTGEANSSRG
ncbi:MAG: NFACT family protein [Desulfurococcales archaeon]|nr:NFACT family protein [Desulfurococcales archaeon]